MDYQPRHAQPFTYEQAVQLDIPMITQEISRLENSLQYLQNTQGELQQHLSTEDDVELREAFKENEAVIASQKERISMLKMALEEKGVNTSSMHYDMRMSVAPSRPAADTSQAVSAGQGDELAEAGIHQGQAGDRDDGLYL